MMANLPVDPQDDPKSSRPRPYKRVHHQTGVSKEYLSLLNETIRDINSRHDPSEFRLESSQIGATFWSSQEKEILFSLLRVHGSGNLSRLQNGLPNKSESEIQAYLLMLREHSTKDLRNPKTDFAFDQVPAAHEISPDCETGLNLAAEAVGARVYKQDAQAAEDEFGDDWLIGEELADDYDLRLQDQEADGIDADESDVEAKDAVEQSLLDSEAASTILRPSALLMLSRSLYMNSSSAPALNWQTLQTVCEDVDEPAIFKSALQDFYNLTVNITRRLVQATLFQAMTRLRAADSSRNDWTPVPVVREADARSAADFLNMPNWKSYWVTAARRNNILVFTDSKKYLDGRPGTKVGVQLTHEEVEAELGAEIPPPTTRSDEHEVAEYDVDHLMEDEDLFTDGPDEEEPLEPANALSTNSAPQSLKRKRKTKSRKPQDPSTFLRTETAYLEALDTKASLDEEQRLASSLRLNLPSKQSHPQPFAEPPGLIPDCERPPQTSWRDTIDYEAEWENRHGTVEPEMFREMEVRGQAGRKRQKRLYLGVQRRLRGEDEGMTDKEWDSEANAGEGESDSEGDELDLGGAASEDEEEDNEKGQSETSASGSESGSEDGGQEAQGHSDEEMERDDLDNDQSDEGDDDVESEESGSEHPIK